MTQPSIPGTAVGIPRMAYGNDGTNWIAVLVDALGHLQADILSSALPTDAATQTTLAGIQALIGALTNPDPGTVNKQLADAVTALQLIDDLRNALGSVNTDDLQVDVKTSGLPTGAAAEATLAHAVEHLTLLSGLVEALESINLDKLVITGTVKAVSSTTFTYAAVTMGVAAAVIKAANSSRLGIAVFNLGSATVYLGYDNTVAVAAGFPLLSNQGLYFDGYTGALWGISGTAGQDVRYLEV